MIRMPALLLTALVATAALTACGPGGAGTPSSSPSGATPSGTPSSAPSDAPLAACTRDDLTSEFAFTDGTAGQLHGLLTVHNIGAVTCLLDGYPTLYIGEPEAEGTMGAAATTDAVDPGASVDLEPGAVAVAHVTVTQAGNVDGCTIVETAYVVYAPPGVVFGTDTAQHVETPPFSGCRNDDIALLMVGGFTAE